MLLSEALNTLREGLKPLFTKIIQDLNGGQIDLDHAHGELLAQMLEHSFERAVEGEGFYKVLQHLLHFTKSDTSPLVTKWIALSNLVTGFVNNASRLPEAEYETELKMLVKVLPESDRKLLIGNINGNSKGDKEAIRAFKLALEKASRTPEKAAYDDRVDKYVFIGREKFAEVPEGSGNYKKSLEIERMMPVDYHDPRSHDMLTMMNLRARFQGNGEVYMITVDKNLLQPYVKDKASGAIDASDLPDYVIDLINKHKQVVR